MIPAQLKEARLTLGLTQPQAARLLGYGDAVRISEIENGKRQPSESVLRLLRLYLVLHKEAPHLLPSDWP